VLDSISKFLDCDPEVNRIEFGPLGPQIRFKLRPQRIAQVWARQIFQGSLNVSLPESPDAFIGRRGA
jgi:hypothetical protein